MIANPIHILKDSKYAIGIFGFGLIYAIPASYLSGMLNPFEALVLGGLFFFNLLAAAYSWTMKREEQKKDLLKHDYYLKNLDLKSDKLFQVSIGILGFVGVPVSFLFDILAAAYSVLSLFDHPWALAIYGFVQERVWLAIWVILTIPIILGVRWIKEKLEIRMKRN